MGNEAARGDALPERVVAPCGPKRTALPWGVALIAAGPAFVAAWLVAWQLRFADQRAAARELSMGATEQELRARLGEPDTAFTILTHGSGTCWAYSPPFVGRFPWLRVLERPRRAVLPFESDSIRLHFGADGRLDFVEVP